MAINITPSLLQEMRLNMDIVLQDYELNRPELKEYQYGALASGVSGAPRFSPLNLNNDKMASSQSVKIPYYSRIANGTATTRGFNPDFEGATNYVDVTTTGFREEVKLSKLMHFENELTWDTQFRMVVSQKLRALRERIDAYCATQLDLARTQVSDFTSNGSLIWDGVGFKMDSAVAEKDNMYSNLKEMATVNRLGESLKFLGSAGAMNQFEFLNAQGSANNTNKSYNKDILNDIVYSPNIAFAGSRYTGYAYREGAFGLYFWNNRLHREGASNGYQEWGTITDPLFGYNIELYVERQRADNSGTVTGAEMDYVESLVMYVDTAFVSAPNNNTDIYKIVQAI